MGKCSKAEVRRLKTALRWKIPAAQRQRIQMVLLRESAITLLGEGRRKFASNNRLESTPDENKSVVQGAIAYFGTYTVNEADHTLNFHIDAARFRIGTGPTRSDL